MAEQSIVRVAVVGAGSMGRNHVRLLGNMAGVRLTGVVDTDAEAGKQAASAYRVRAVPNIAELPETDAVVIATPTRTHLAIASAAMKAGCHVLVEKPLAPSVEEAEQLVRVANETGRVLAVGQVERFNAAFGVLKSICRDPQLLSFERLSPFTPRISDTVVMDLMVHDLDLAMWILGAYPEKVEAAGSAVFSDSVDIASAVLTFPGGAIATLQASRATQDKVRRISISERERFVVADSIRQDVLIKRETSVGFSEETGSQAYKQANVVEIPYLDRSGEPLARELRDFLDAIREAREPLTTGRDGVAAVRLAREIDAQIAGVGPAPTVPPSA